MSKFWNSLWNEAEVVEHEGSTDWVRGLILSIWALEMLKTVNLNSNVRAMLYTNWKVESRVENVMMVNSAMGGSDVKIEVGMSSLNVR